ncbi:uncharacterized protein LOC142972968 [Anticarsia gemmatalis]|uniref:uncharacterized protein LOC142972968 n=1 Tax=Anticarsia gemmatalis TaxID=129554 RepID=UPI003F767328
MLISLKNFPVVLLLVHSVTCANIYETKRLPRQAKNVASRYGFNHPPSIERYAPDSVEYDDDEEEDDEPLSRESVEEDYDSDEDYEENFNDDDSTTAKSTPKVFRPTPRYANRPPSIERYNPYLRPKGRAVNIPVSITTKSPVSKFKPKNPRRLPGSNLGSVNQVQITNEEKPETTVTQIEITTPVIIDEIEKPKTTEAPVEVTTPKVEETEKPKTVEVTTSKYVKFQKPRATVIPRVTVSKFKPKNPKTTATPVVVTTSKIEEITEPLTTAAPIEVTTLKVEEIQKPKTTEAPVEVTTSKIVEPPIPKTTAIPIVVTTTKKIEKLQKPKATVAQVEVTTPKFVKSSIPRTTATPTEVTTSKIERLQRPRTTVAPVQVTISRVERLQRPKTTAAQVEVTTQKVEKPKKPKSIATPIEVTSSRVKESQKSNEPSPKYNFKKRTEGPDPVVPIVESENYVYAYNGDYHYSYEGGDGTKAFARGELKPADDGSSGGVVGGYSYTDKDGNDFSLSYTADENGYRPVGAHLPTPPPIPLAIQRALEILATKTTPEPVTEKLHKFY